MELYPSTTFGGMVIKSIILCLFLIILTGCKKEHPNPEQLDPIYKDLSSEYSNHVKSLEDEEKKLLTLKEDLDAKKKGTMDYVTALKLYNKSRNLVKTLEQEVKYLKIRTERRKVEGRRKYKIAFENGETWPEPKEFEQYQLSKKLQSVDLNWNKRVPKLDINNPNYKKNQK